MQIVCISSAIINPQDDIHGFIARGQNCVPSVQGGLCAKYINLTKSLKIRDVILMHSYYIHLTNFICNLHKNVNT